MGGGAAARDPPAAEGPARKPKVGARSVAALAEEDFARESRSVTLPQTTKEGLSYKLWVKEVWLGNGTGGPARRRLLVVRQEADGSHKYSLSNAPAHTSWERLGFMQAQRFWIERAFQDAKSELGMAQYEVRTWRGWHHHMALVCLGLLFVLKERVLAAEHTPLLSARDVVELLAFYLPRRTRDPGEILRMMQTRHRQRAKATKHFRRKKRALVTK